VWPAGEGGGVRPLGCPEQSGMGGDGVSNLATLEAGGYVSLRSRYRRDLCVCTCGYEQHGEDRMRTASTTAW
jgi:hypothetical protein